MPYRRDRNNNDYVIVQLLGILVAIASVALCYFFMTNNSHLVKTTENKRVAMPEEVQEQLAIMCKKMQELRQSKVYENVSQRNMKDMNETDCDSN